MAKKAACGIFLIALFALGFAAHAQSYDKTPPTTPTGISAYLTLSSQIYISWGPSTDNVGVVGYYLYRNGALVDNSPGYTFYTDNAPPGVYVYTVAAYDAAGNISPQSAPTQPVAVNADTTPPTTPGNFTGTPSSSSIVLSWSPSTDNVGVVGYYISRNGARITTASAITGATYTDIGLAPGVNYRYALAAYDAAGNSSNAATLSVSTIFDITPPTTPYGLVVSPLSAYQVNLSWQPSTDNLAVLGYAVYRDGAQVGTSATTSYLDGTAAQTSYSYSVAAYDTVGNLSPMSAAAKITTPPPDLTPPSIPSGLFPKPVSASEIDLSWSPSTDNVSVAGYYVYRDDAQIGTTASTSFKDTGLATSTTHMYAVKAYDSSGNISPQTSAAATTLAVNPASPPVPPPIVLQSTTYASPSQVSYPAAGVTSSAGAGATFTLFLSPGGRGAQVAALQTLLINKGYLKSLATGYFGALTERALQRLQCDQGIICSGGPYTTGWGLVGARTRKALNALSGQ